MNRLQVFGRTRIQFCFKSQLADERKDPRSALKTAFESAYKTAEEHGRTSTSYHLFFEDVAAAKTTDEEGTTWLHVYMTNSELAIYATISGPAQAKVEEADWALTALQTIKPRWDDHRNN